MTGLPDRRHHWNHAGDSGSLAFPLIGAVGVQPGRGNQAIRISQRQFHRSLGALAIYSRHDQPWHVGGTGQEVLGRTTIKL